jgi:hypothetical protein
MLPGATKQLCSACSITPCVYVSTVESCLLQFASNDGLALPLQYFFHPRKLLIELQAFGVRQRTTGLDHTTRYNLFDRQFNLFQIHCCLFTIH